MNKGLKETFYSKYGEKPNMVVQSPGRVNTVSYTHLRAHET